MKNFNEYFMNESMGDIHPIHIPNDVLESGIFWGDETKPKVMLSNLVNSLKKHYGYLTWTFDNVEDNPQGVQMGVEFIENQYPDLATMIEKGDRQIELEQSINSPNSFYIRFM